jgi:hypothetical protein
MLDIKIKMKREEPKLRSFFIFFFETSRLRVQKIKRDY